MTSPSGAPGRARKAGPSAPKERPAVDRKYVAALGRGLQVLRCFDSRDRWLANQEIAMRTGLAKPTITRLAYTLVKTGYLRYSDSHGNYALGSAARRLGFVAMAQMDVRRVAREPMQSLAEYVKGAIHLSVREGLSMVLVDTYRNPGAFFVDIGSRVPIASTSIGRAYFCGLPQAEQRKLLDELRGAHADQWPQLRKAFDQAVLGHQQRGFCIALGEWRREVNGVSVPLALADETDPVVFSCSGASFQLDIDLLNKEVGPRLLTLVGNVRSALAGA
jgi:DNA-binding IclR family transcriptional regulator